MNARDETKRLLDEARRKMNDPEMIAILDAIAAVPGRSTTQVSLTRQSDWHAALAARGSTPDEIRDLTETAAGERRVRELVRRARVEFRAPVCSGPRGYFIPQTFEEIDEFLARLSAEAKARAMSSLRTAREMRDLFTRPRQEVFLLLLEDAVAKAEAHEAASGGDRPRPTVDDPVSILGAELARTRAELAALKSKVARWGRPTNAARAEKAAAASGAPSLFEVPS